MKHFRIRHNYAEHDYYRLDGQRPISVPGVNCSSCGEIWATTGLSYPQLDLAGFPMIRKCKAGVVPLETYLSLRSMLFEYYPQIPIIQPGTEFGPLHLKVTKKGEFECLMEWYWTMLMPTSMIKSLGEEGVTLPPYVKPVFKPADFDLVEIPLPPLGRMTNPIRAEGPACKACGREGVSMPPEIEIDVSDVPSGTDVFRLANFPTVIIVSERFKNAVESRSIRGVDFVPVAVRA